VTSSLSIGPIACNNKTQTFSTGFYYLPYLYGYSINGDLTWIVEIGNFTPQEITATSNKVSHTLSQKKPYHLLLNTISFHSSEYNLLQVAYYGGVNAPEYDKLFTYIVSTKKGEGIFVSDALPLIHHITDDRIFASESSPYPKIDVYEYQ